MRFVSFEHNARPGYGLLEEDEVRSLGGRDGAPATLVDLIAQGHEGLDWAKKAASEAPSIPKSEIAYLPPVVRPGKVIALGRNYAAHAKEGGAEPPKYPMLFHKTHTSLSGHNRPIVIPHGAEKIDYEAELAVIIGRTAKNVAEADALDYVFGYSAANDITSRGLQRRTSQFTAGKMIDGFGPLGPVLVTADEIEDVQALQITSFLNGKPMQNGNTRDMIFSVAFTIADLSKITTLEPGDVILTGTPEGVGFAQNPPAFMVPGDEIVVEVEGVGRLVNRMVADDQS